LLLDTFPGPTYHLLSCPSLASPDWPRANHRRVRSSPLHPVSPSSHKASLMLRLASAFLVATGMALVSPAAAGEFNKKLSIGDAAPAFADLEGVDGKK